MTRLGIDTSTRRTSVAWETGGDIQQLVSDEPRQARVLATMMEQALDTIGGADRIDDVVVGVGPGSFTALRIGISFAKGLCRAFDIPAIAVSSVDACCIEHRGPTSVLVAMDARKGELFGGIYDTRAQVRVPLRVDAAAAWVSSMRAKSEELELMVVGDALDSSPDLFSWVPNERRLAMTTHGPSARALLLYAADRGLQRVDASRIEPLYLRASDAELNGPRGLKVPVG